MNHIYFKENEMQIHKNLKMSYWTRENCEVCDDLWILVVIVERNALKKIIEECPHLAGFLSLDLVGFLGFCHKWNIP